MIDVPEVVTTIAAAVALALSVWNFAERWVRDRKASLSARVESYMPATPEPGGQMHTRGFHRLVVTNHGPADADDVEIRIPDQDLRPIGKPRLDVPRLHVGQEYHVEFRRGWADHSLERVSLAWTDRRRARQHRDVWVSTHRLH